MALWRPRQAWMMTRQMGPGWVMFRAGYALKRRTGWFERRCPPRTWSASAKAAPAIVNAIRRSPVPFVAGTIAPRADRLRTIVGPDRIQQIVREAGNLRDGTWSVFGTEYSLGCPPPWHRHPVTRAEWPRAHWSTLHDADESDVKWLWEPGRFGAAFTLTRAFWLTGDAAHAETFWSLVESWRAENPPNVGVHWMCGQECSFRTIAWLFALFALIDAPATTPARVAMLIEMLAAHGERIEANLDYARSQKNNHGINEALGLWTLGTLLPHFERAVRWEAIGRELLEEEAQRQIYPDGAYVQQSLSYHRLVLQSYAWAVLVGAAIGRPFSAALIERCSRATRFLHQVTDPVSGRMPNYGANDGAVLLPLHAGAPEYVRPTLALAFWAAERRRVAGSGGWDESLFWLAGDDALDAAPSPVEQVNLSADTGGYYTIRGSETWAFTRCAVYRDRPSQADMLHVDLWWRGENIIADPGTFAYTGTPPWDNGLVSTRVHNTVAVDGLDQMERTSRFGWIHWNRGRVIGRNAPGTGRFEGEHDGYLRSRGVVHRRAILLLDDCLWLIVDDLFGDAVHDLSSQWIFPGGLLDARSETDWQVRTAAGTFNCSFFSFGASGTADLHVAEPGGDDVTGWYARGYGRKTRAAALITAERTLLPVRRITAIVLDDTRRLHVMDATRCVLDVGGARRIDVRLRPLPYAPDLSLIESCTSS